MPAPPKLEARSILRLCSSPTRLSGIPQSPAMSEGTARWPGHAPERDVARPSPTLPWTRLRTLALMVLPMRTPTPEPTRRPSSCPSSRSSRHWSLRFPETLRQRSAQPQSETAAPLVMPAPQQAWAAADDRSAAHAEAQAAHRPPARAPQALSLTSDETHPAASCTHRQRHIEIDSRVAGTARTATHLRS